MFAQNGDHKSSEVRVQRQQQVQHRAQQHQQTQQQQTQQYQIHAQQYQQHQKQMQYQQHEQHVQQQESRLQQQQQQFQHQQNQQQQQQKQQQLRFENGHRRSSNASLSEIDQQIITIQNEFEAELDTLIDAYRSMQQAKKKGFIRLVFLTPCHLKQRNIKLFHKCTEDTPRRKKLLKMQSNTIGCNS
jgi:hypothetical protein